MYILEGVYIKQVTFLCKNPNNPTRFQTGPRIGAKMLVDGYQMSAKSTFIYRILTGDININLGSQVHVTLWWWVFYMQPCTTQKHHPSPMLHSLECINMKKCTNLQHDSQRSAEFVDPCFTTNSPRVANPSPRLQIIQQVKNEEVAKFMKDNNIHHRSYTRDTTFRYT